VDITGKTEKHSKSANLSRGCIWIGIVDRNVVSASGFWSPEKLTDCFLSRCVYPSKYFTTSQLLQTDSTTLCHGHNDANKSGRSVRQTNDGRTKLTTVRDGRRDALRKKQKKSANFGVFDRILGTSGVEWFYTGSTLFLRYPNSLNVGFTDCSLCAEKQRDYSAVSIQIPACDGQRKGHSINRANFIHKFEIITVRDKQFIYRQTNKRRQRQNTISLVEEIMVSRVYWSYWSKQIAGMGDMVRWSVLT